MVSKGFIYNLSKVFGGLYSVCKAKRLYLKKSFPETCRINKETLKYLLLIIVHDLIVTHLENILSFKCTIDASDAIKKDTQVLIESGNSSL